MGITITNTKIDNTDISMSNGGASVFFETICLAGADIATELYQKDLMIWFGQRDWKIMGLGTEGFDIAEIAWDDKIFNAQRDFIALLLERVKDKTNWNLLDYTPHEFIFQTIAKFEEMISNFKIDCIEKLNEIEVFDFDGKINRYDKCAIHTIYKHYKGCLLCNNAIIKNI